MITYEEFFKINVYLNKRHVGNIFKNDEGYFFSALYGITSMGETFPTIDDVKKSLEG